MITGRLFSNSRPVFFAPDAANPLQKTGLHLTGHLMWAMLGRTPITFTLDYQQWFPQPLEKVFAFFADAMNLEQITPRWLHFQVLTPAPIEMKVGTLIDYKLRLHGLPLRWRTRIAAWEPPVRFVDEQIRGPYKLWRHLHTFVPKDGGTLVTDHVDYQMIGGRLVNRFFVQPDLKKIFSHRQQAMTAIFGGGPAMNSPVAAHDLLHVPS